MPYPNEHACRIRSPDDFQSDSFRRIKRKDLNIVIGRPKGKATTEAQAYRYPIGDWTESRARAHCKEAGGSFEAASKEEKAMTEITLFEIDGQMVTFDDLEAVYKARLEQEKPCKDEKSTLAVKFLREQDGGAVVGGHIALWGDADRKDLQGDYFTKATELWLDKYQTVPALFHHGLDEAVGLSVIGRRIKSGVDDVGAWVEDWLDKSSKYWALVKPLLDAEALYYSPGSAPHLIKRSDDGELLSYPIVEDTLTLIPAQHRLRPIEQIKAAYKAAGLDWPELLADGGDDAGASCQEAKAKARAVALLAHIKQKQQE